MQNYSKKKIMIGILKETLNLLEQRFLIFLKLRPPLKFYKQPADSYKFMFSKWEFVGRCYNEIQRVHQEVCQTYFLGSDKNFLKMDLVKIQLKI